MRKPKRAHIKTLSFLLAIIMAASLLSVTTLADGETLPADPETAEAALETETVPDEVSLHEEAPEAEETAAAEEFSEEEAIPEEEAASEGDELPAEAIPEEETLPAEGFGEETEAAAEEPLAEEEVAAAADGEDQQIIVTFSTDGNATVNVYYGKSYTGSPDESNASSAYPRAKSGDGSIDNSGAGQVNFAVVPAEGYVIDTVAASPAGAFGNLKGSEDTGVEGVYRITKVGADVTVSITTKPAGGEQAEPDPYTYYLTPEGFADSLGRLTGKDSLKITESGTYTVEGQNLDDYVNGRIQIKAEDVSLVLKDVWLIYSNAAVINAEFDTVIDINGDCRLERVIDPDSFSKKDYDEDGYCDEDGGKVIKGESKTFGESVSLTFTGPGCLTIDAPKKGIGVDVFMDEETNPEEKMTVKLDATITFAMDEPAEGSDQEYNLVIHSAHEGIEGNAVIFKSGVGMIDATDIYEWSYINPVTNEEVFCSNRGDDGVNAATDADDKVDRNGKETEGSGEPKYNVKYNSLDMYIEFDGGRWYFNTAEDGLDSNGSIYINGGETTVFSEAPDSDSPPSDGGAVDPADDAGAVFNYTGGRLLTAGSNLIQKMPNTGTYLYFSGRSAFNNNGFGRSQTSQGTEVNIKAGDKVYIIDENGNVLDGSEFQAIKSANCVLFLSEDVVLGDEYTIVINGRKAATVTAKSKDSGSSDDGPSREPGWSSEEPEEPSREPGDSENLISNRTDGRTATASTGSNAARTGGNQNGKGSNEPATGDSGNAVIWTIVLLFSGTSAAAVSVAMRKRRNRG